MDAEPMESDADLVLDLLDTVKQSETPVVKRCKKKSKKKSNSIIERREVAKSLLGLEKSNSIIERQEVAKRLLGLEKFRNVDTDIADFTVLFKPTLPKGVHEEGKHDVSLGRKEDSVTSTHSSVASTHSSAASTHSSAASTHSSVASTHSSAASIHSSVASTHSSAASTHSSAASTRSSIPQAASTLIQDNKPISQYVDNTNIGHPLDSTSTKGHEMKPSENVQLQRPTTKGVKVKRLLDSSLAWMSVRENEGYLMPGAIKDTKSEIQLSKKAKRRARREAIKTQKVALDIKSTEKTDISNERTGEHTETVILSKKARKRARRQAMNKPEGLSQVESTENIVTPRAPAMEFTHSAALPKKDRKEEAEHQTSSTSPMTDLKTMYSAQGAIPKSSMNKDLDIYSSILLGRGFWKLTPPGIKNRKISKTLPPARRGGPPARRGGPPARRGGPPARRGGPPARRGGPPARSTGPAVSNPLLEWGVHNTKNGSVPRGFSMQTMKTRVAPSIRIRFLTNGYWILIPCSVRYNQSRDKLSEEQEALFYKQHNEYPNAIVALDAKHKRKGKERIKFTRLRPSPEKRKRRRDGVDKHVEFWCPDSTLPTRNRSNCNKGKRQKFEATTCNDSTSSNSQREIKEMTGKGLGISKEIPKRICKCAGSHISADTKSHPYGANMCKTDMQLGPSVCAKQTNKTKPNVGHGLRIAWCEDMPEFIGHNQLHKNIYLIHDDTRSTLLETRKTVMNKNLSRALQRNLEMQSLNLVPESKDFKTANQFMANANDSKLLFGKQIDTDYASCRLNQIRNNGCEVVSKPVASKLSKAAEKRAKKGSAKKVTENVLALAESKILKAAEKKGKASSVKKATEIKEESKLLKKGDFDLFVNKHFRKTKSEELPKQTTPKKTRKKQKTAAKTDCKKPVHDDYPTSTTKTSPMAANRVSEATATGDVTSALEEKLLNLDAAKQLDLQNCICVNGIEEKDGENTNEIILSIAIALNIKMTIQEIEHSARVGRQSTGKTREIFVKFRSLASRQKLYKKRNLVRCVPGYENVFVNEALTHRRRHLYFEARKLRKANKITFAWTNDGEILVKDNDSKKHTIVTERDLDQFKE